MHKPRLTFAVALCGVLGALAACVGDNPKPDGAGDIDKDVADASSSSSGTPVVVGSSSSSSSGALPDTGSSSSSGSAVDAGADAAPTPPDPACSVAVPVTSAEVQPGCGFALPPNDLQLLLAGSYDLTSVGNNKILVNGVCSQDSEPWRAALKVESAVDHWIFHLSMEVNGIRADYHLSVTVNVDHKGIIGKSLCGGEVPFPKDVDGDPEARGASFWAKKTQEGQDAVTLVVTGPVGGTRTLNFVKK